MEERFNLVAKLYLGCSGWDYDEWVGPFYQKRAGTRLAQYTSVFDTAEINSTFYRYPSEGVVKGWIDHTPDDFVFTAKMPQLVTHDKWMDIGKGVSEDVHRFLDLMRPLNESGKLKCILIQMRPKMTFESYRTIKFLECLDPSFRYAIEFRNSSWIDPEAFEILREFKVAYTCVDEPLLAPDVHITTDFAYIRWHGHGENIWYDYRYSKEELQAWVPKVKEIMVKDVDTYAYFNNHFHGNAPENGLEILEMLGALTDKQKAYLEDKRKGGKATSLDDFF